MTPFPTAAKLMMSHRNKNNKNHMVNGKISHIHQKNKFAIETYRATRATCQNESDIKKAWFICNYLGHSQKQEEYKETKMTTDGRKFVDKQRDDILEINMHITNFQAEIKRIDSDLAGLQDVPSEDDSHIDIQESKRHRARERFLAAQHEYFKLRRDPSAQEEELLCAIHKYNQAQIEHLKIRKAYILYEIPRCHAHIKKAEARIFRCFEAEFPGIELERQKRLSDLTHVANNGPM